MARRGPPTCKLGEWSSSFETNYFRAQFSKYSNSLAIQAQIYHWHLDLFLVSIWSGWPTIRGLFTQAVSSEFTFVCFLPRIKYLYNPDKMMTSYQWMMGLKVRRGNRVLMSFFFLWKNTPAIRTVRLNGASSDQTVVVLKTCCFVHPWQTETTMSFFVFHLSFPLITLRHL